MSRFNNQGTPRVGPRSAIKSEGIELTEERGQGYTRDAKGELFLLAASFMGGDDNFYEKSDSRYNRLINLLNQNEIVSDPKWIYHLVQWLRTEANMRTVSMVIALEAVNARLVVGETDPFLVEILDIPQRQTYGVRTNRDIVDVSMSRADEPAEAIAYWHAKHGKPLPQPIKNGIADAATRLYNEFSFIKYGESRTASYTMKDVLRITHPTPKGIQQNILFEYITSKDREATLRLFSQRDVLGVIRERKRLYDMPREERVLDNSATNAFKDAGMTWESVSEWYPGGMNAEAWEAMIPNMGIMALIRNLRNFDQAEISDDSRRYVRGQIMNREVVRKSRQLPFRWYNAYRSVESLNYALALEKALDMSLDNVPVLNGQTLVLVDMSGSMFYSKVSPKSKVTYADAASLFGSAIKLRNPYGVDLFQYGSTFESVGVLYTNHFGSNFSDYPTSERWSGVTKEVPIDKGASLLRTMSKFQDMGGTMTHQAVAETFNPKYKRVIILTDEQSWDTNYDDLPVPHNVPVYIWNIAGYSVGTMPTGSNGRHVFGGLSDSAFKLIPILESGRDSSWPWNVQ